MSTRKKKPKTLCEVFTEDAETPGTNAWFENVRETYGNLLRRDGYDDCIIGLTTQFNTTTILYDRDKVIHKLAADFRKADKKLSKSQAYDDANDYSQFNIEGAWMGKETPSFFTKS
jgi:hypothetical protein